MSVILSPIGGGIGGIVGLQIATALGVEGSLTVAAFAIGAVAGVVLWEASPLPSGTRGPL